MLELGHRLYKAGNVVMYARLATRSSKFVDHRLNLLRRHVARRTEDAAEDKDKVYDVAHHKADILIAKERVEADYVIDGWMARSPIFVIISQPRSSRHRCANRLRAMNIGSLNIRF